MSIDEARQHKAMALLEFDEAMEEREAVLAEIRKLELNAEKVRTFLSNLTLGNDYADSQANRLRDVVYGLASCDLVPAAIILDGNLSAASKRLREAIAIKKTFGLK